MNPEQLSTWVLSVAVLGLFVFVLVNDVGRYAEVVRTGERRRGVAAARLRAVIKSIIIVAGTASIAATSTLATFGPEDDEARRVLGLVNRAVVTGALLVGGLALVASIWLDRRRREGPDAD